MEEQKRKQKAKTVTHPAVVLLPKYITITTYAQKSHAQHCIS